jgi:putative N-acetyltransferase (TIGR04045 family)
VSVAASRSITPAEPTVVSRPSCRVARSAEERARHFEVRHAVFVVEQRIFAGDDRDASDSDPATVHAIGAVDGVIGGAVRLYPIGDDDDGPLWKGDRLAVLPAHRHGALGANMVRFAVATAGALGGERMLAMIQLPNVTFFRSLGWHESAAPQQYHGIVHQPMEIALRAPADVSRRTP